MKGIGAIVAGLAAAMSVAGKVGMPGAKLARHADELRLGLRHGVSYPLKPTKRMLRVARGRMT